MRRLKPEYDTGDPVLTSEQAEPFLHAVEEWFCHCGEPLRGEPIKHYPHDGGWTVKGLTGKQWLYIICPKCGYQLALWKLGVPRE